LSTGADVAEPLLRQLGLPPFQPRFPWLNGDLQTLRDTLHPPRLPCDGGTPLTIPVGGGDQLLALQDPALPLGRDPVALVLLLHGLGGGSEREGLRRMGHTLQRSGFAVLRLNLRGAGAGRALARGTYAARCNRDLLPVLRRARQLAGELAPGGRPLLGVGLSLGGTQLLNALLERAEQPLLDGLVCLSSPLDLEACSRQIDRPRNRLYQRWLLRRLLQQTLADPFGVPEPERQRLHGQGPAGPLRTLRAFDAAITAPRWGYGSVEAYYADASPLLPLLEGGAARLPPSLLVHAADDPWVPVAPMRRLAAAAPAGLELLITAQGGHNGFHGCGDGHGDGAGGYGSWGDRLTARWLTRLLADAPGAAGG
jgi:predicted alpha/beta-fold hydrolase